MKSYFIIMFFPIIMKYDFIIIGKTSPVYCKTNFHLIKGCVKV